MALRDCHWEQAAEQWLYWRRLGLTNGEMLGALGLAGPNAPTALYILCRLADAASELQQGLADAA